MSQTVRTAVTTEQGPAAIGPYSQAIKANGFVFVSGQIALDPSTNTLIQGGIRGQTERVMKNLAGILEAAGSSLSQAVKTTVYLADMNEFAEMNEVYGTFFSEAPPARATVEVRRLPKDVKVEIDVVALAS